MRRADGAPQLDAVDENGRERYGMLNLLSRSWFDVNNRVWERRSDRLAGVLRSFREKDSRLYSTRFATFNMAIFAADIIRRYRLDLKLLAALAKGTLDKKLRDLAYNRSMDRRMAVYVQFVDAQIPADFDEREVALCERLRRFSVALDTAFEEARQLQTLIADALPSGVRLGDAAEASLVAFGLRRAGFRIREIVALLGMEPQEELRPSKRHLYRAELHKAREDMRSTLNRLAAKVSGTKLSK
jgi:hypothetical protein